MDKLTRRSFGALAGLTLAPPAAAAQAPALAALNLPPAIYEELAKRAEAAIQEARRLEELPLEDVDPGFVFEPR